MVRAILDGRKSQTRRAVTGKPAYAEAGARLWVKELWRADSSHDHLRPGQIPRASAVIYAADDAATPGKKRSVLFMPRWASRITLEVVEVRVESLHDITEHDARAEGVESRDAYHALWDSINALRGLAWKTNPAVWVIEFKRVPR
jgi:hypothetical protein